MATCGVWPRPWRPLRSPAPCWADGEVRGRPQAGAGAGARRLHVRVKTVQGPAVVRAWFSFVHQALAAGTLCARHYSGHRTDGSKAEKVAALRASTQGGCPGRTSDTAPGGGRRGGRKTGCGWVGRDFRHVGRAETPVPLSPRPAWRRRGVRGAGLTDRGRGKWSCDICPVRKASRRRGKERLRRACCRRRGRGARRGRHHFARTENKLYSEF